MNAGVWGWSGRHWYEVKFSFTHTRTRARAPPCVQSHEWEESSFTAISLGHWEIEKAQIF